MSTLRKKQRCIYWQPESLRTALYNAAPIDGIFSAQFVHVRPGETVWIVGNLDERFVCIGYAVVEKTTPRGSDFVIEARDPVAPRIVDLTTEWKEFFTFAGKYSLEHDGRDLPDGRSLQSMRELSAKAERWLARRWKESAQEGSCGVVQAVRL